MARSGLRKRKVGKEVDGEYKRDDTAEGKKDDTAEGKKDVRKRQRHSDDSEKPPAINASAAGAAGTFHSLPPQRNPVN